MTSGMIGGIIGGVLGTLGGVFGTYCSIKNTNGPRERQFMIKGAVVCWIAVIVFLLLLFLLPRPYNFCVWIPYGILLPLGIVKGNKAQQRIRREEADENNEQDAEP
jgi:Ca2+/Na+ antiporter